MLRKREGERWTSGGNERSRGVICLHFRTNKLCLMSTAENKKKRVSKGMTWQAHWIEKSHWKGNEKKGTP